MRLLIFTTLFITSLNSLAEVSFEFGLLALSQEQRQSYGLRTEQVETVTEVLGARYPAEVVVPNSQLQVISALQGGLVESLHVAEGDHVKKGQLLASIKSPGMLVLQRELLQTLTQLNLAESTLNRDKQLLDEGIIPKRRYLQSLSIWQELVTQKQQQVATLLYSGMSRTGISSLEKNRKLDSAFTVSAPFAGVVLEQMVIPGEKLEAAGPLFKIGKLSPLWLEIHVPVDVVSEIVLGDVISVPELEIEGEIITIGRMVHSADQGTLVRAILRDNVEQLRPGQVVQAQVAYKNEHQHRYLVPRNSIVRLDTKTLVFIEVTGGFTAVNVEVLGSRKGQQIIRSNHEISTRVVTRGAAILKAILIGVGGEG